WIGQRPLDLRASQLAQRDSRPGRYVHGPSATALQPGAPLLQQRYQRELAKVQRTSLGVAVKDEKPAMRRAERGPAKLPIRAFAQEIVLDHAVVEGPLEHVLQQQIRRRVRSVRRIVADFQEMNPFGINEGVVEGRSSLATSQEVQPQPSATRR